VVYRTQITKSANTWIAQQYQRNLYIVEKYPTSSAQQFPRRQCGSIFIRLVVVAYQTCHLAQNSDRIWTYSSSRSSKVDDFGTNQKCICHFLLVINSNFGPILHRFWDTATYWLKIAYFSYPSFIRRPRWGTLPMFPFEFHVRKLESWGYTVVKVAWSQLQPSLTDPPMWRTDRRTDGR